MRVSFSGLIMSKRSLLGYVQSTFLRGVYIRRAVSEAESQEVGEWPGLDQERVGVGKVGWGTEDLRQRNKGTGTGGGRRGS